MKENLLNIKTMQDVIAETKKNIAIIKEKHEKELQPLNEAVKTLEEKIEAEKKIIEPIVLKKFNETKEKKYEGGVGVQERKELTYDEVKVFEWALEKKMFLSLDKKSFEKVAENIGAPTVKVDKKLLVTYPKELKIED